MKQTLTRDGFTMALQKKDRSDPVAHNFMLVGQILFDLNEKLDELLERTKDLYHPTVAGPKIKALKIDPTSDIPQEDERIEPL